MSVDVDKLLTRPIIILGSPRSGTTILGSILSHHPELHYLEEPRLTWRIGNDHKSDMLRPDDARPEVIAAIRRRFAEQVEAAGKRRLLEKTPSNALRVSFVDAVIPDALFVHILRDPVETVLSIRSFWEKHTRGVPAAAVRKRLSELDWRRLLHYSREVVRRLRPDWMKRWVKPPIWGPRLPGIDEMARELDALDLACLQWRFCVERACIEGRKLPPDRYLEIQLEGLDAAMLDRIMAFCDLPASDAVHDAFGQEFRPQSGPSRATQANPADLQRIEDAIAPTRTWLETGDEKEPNTRGSRSSITAHLTAHLPPL